MVAAYSLSHGSIQLVIGPIGDRFGKYRTVAVMCALAAVLVALCGTAQSLPALALARFASGAAAGWIIPISMAYVGDVTPYERRQQMLARYLSGQIIGQLFGQAAGGVLGDLLGWRNVFFVLAGMFALATVALVLELLANPLTRAPGTRGGNLARLRRRLCRRALQSVGADRHPRGVHRGQHRLGRVRLCGRRPASALRPELLGGRPDRRHVRHRRPHLCRLGAAAGQPARADRAWRSPAACCSALAYLTLAIGAAWWLAPLAVTAIGLGFYMLHNTLQTNATQMTPQARGTAVAIFSSAIYLGQMLGVARRRWCSTVPPRRCSS